MNIEVDPVLRREHREEVVRRLAANKKQLFDMLLADVERCKPKTDHIVYHFSCLDVTRVPQLRGPQAVWFETIIPHLAHLWDP